MEWKAVNDQGGGRRKRELPKMASEQVGAIPSPSLL